MQIKYMNELCDIENILIAHDITMSELTKLADNSDEYGNFAIDDLEYKKTNREKSQSPKTGKFWCDLCDRSLVGHGAKCPHCGKVGSVKKTILKKESNS